MVKIVFEIDNSAFEKSGIIMEIARILRELAYKLETGRDTTNIFDYNDNKIGTMSIKFTRR